MVGTARLPLHAPGPAGRRSSGPSRGSASRRRSARCRSNKPLAYLCGSSFFYLIGVFAVGGTTAFYAQYVLGNIGLVGIITLVNTGITLLITPFIPKIIDIFGKKNVYQYCGLFTIVGGVGLFFAPANMFWLVLLTLAIKGIGASLINTVMFGLEADTVEYGESQTGQRSEGATYALFSFTRKVTQSIGGAAGAWALAAGSYIAASADQPEPGAARVGDLRDQGHHRPAARGLSP